MVKLGLLRISLQPLERGKKQAKVSIYEPQMLLFCTWMDLRIILRNLILLGRTSKETWMGDAFSIVKNIKYSFCIWWLNKSLLNLSHTQKTKHYH